MGLFCCGQRITRAWHGKVGAAQTRDYSGKGKRGRKKVKATDLKTRMWPCGRVFSGLPPCLRLCLDSHLGLFFHLSSFFHTFKVLSLFRELSSKVESEALREKMRKTATATCVSLKVTFLEAWRIFLHHGAFSSLLFFYILHSAPTLNETWFISYNVSKRGRKRKLYFPSKFRREQAGMDFSLKQNK